MAYEKKTVDYLTDLLRKRDSTIMELEDRVAELESQLKGMAWGWTIHETLTENENMGLPIPRLELRWRLWDDGEYNLACGYNLVYRHLLGHIVSIPLSFTRRGGGIDREPIRPNGSIDTPFRDGAHAANEAEQLGLPCFVIWKDRVQEMTFGNCPR